VLQYCSPPLTGHVQAGWAHLLETGLLTVELIHSPLGFRFEMEFRNPRVARLGNLVSKSVTAGIMRISSGEGSGCIAILLDLQLVTRRVP
jgi:hypothetical protein